MLKLNDKNRDAENPLIAKFVLISNKFHLCFRTAANRPK